MTDLATTESTPVVEPPSERSRIPSRLGIALGAIALVATVQAAIAGVNHTRGPFFDERRFQLWATNLSDRGFYGDLPSQQPAVAELRTVGYSAYVPPGYPFVLIALRAFGSGTAPIRAAQAILVGITVLAAGYTAFRLFGPIAALLTEVLLVASGVLATYAEFTLSETLSAATLIGSVALATVGIQKRSWRLLLGAGVLLGCSSLVRPQVWLLPIPIGALIFLTTGRRRAALILTAAFVLASFGTIAPWTIRNELRLHAFVPVSTYTWINFWLVNNPGADGRFRLPEHYIGVARVRAIRALPEVPQDDVWRRMAIAWVRAHPAAALKGWVRNEWIFVSHPDPLVQRWYGLAGPQPPRLDERYFLPVALLTAIGGLFARREWRAMGVSIIVVVYFLAFFALFLPDPRFRVPLIPVIAIFAAGLPETLLALKARIGARNEALAA
jgi:4-amino-4-deoxy-L-arabinose transferase-like glycosyltransferase